MMTHLGKATRKQKEWGWVKFEKWWVSNVGGSS